MRAGLRAGRGTKLDDNTIRIPRTMPAPGDFAICVSCHEIMSASAGGFMVIRGTIYCKINGCDIQAMQNQPGCKGCGK